MYCMLAKIFANARAFLLCFFLVILTYSCFLLLTFILIFPGPLICFLVTFFFLPLIGLIVIMVIYVTEIEAEVAVLQSQQETAEKKFDQIDAKLDRLLDILISNSGR